MQNKLTLLDIYHVILNIQIKCTHENAPVVIIQVGLVHVASDFKTETYFAEVNLPYKIPMVFIRNLTRSKLT